MTAPTNRRLITEARLLDGTGKVRTTLLPSELGLSTSDVASILAASIFDPEGITITLNDEADAIFVNSIAVDQPPNIYTTSHILVLADSEVPVEMNSSSANSVTVPLHSAVPFPVGSVIEVVQTDVGITSIVSDGGVSVRSRGDLFTLAGQWATVSLRQRGINDWILAGDVI
jgi:hypothetical protein